MDINDLRIAVTVASLVLFIALMLHTYARARGADHESARRLPFEGDDS